MAWDAMRAGQLQAPIFLVSARYRKEAKAAIEATGHSVIAPDFLDDHCRAFRNSDAFIAVVDARGALDRGLDQARGLASGVEKRRGGMLVLLSRNDGSALDRVYDAGATHYLISPFGARELGIALSFVERSIRRMQSSGTEAAVAGAQALLNASAHWRWQVGAKRLDISRDLAALVGQPPSTRSLPLKDAFAMVTRAERKAAARAFRRLVAASVPGEVRHRLEIEGQLHSFIHHVRPVRDEAGQLTGLAATVEDLDAGAAERRLSAHYDSLTGLASITYARAWIDEVLNGEESHDPAAIAVLIGISRLDQVNAVHGRAIADALLQAVARRLKRVLAERASDNVLVARLGGAEFVVLFAGPVMLNQAVFFSQAVAKMFAKPFVIGGRVIHVACRIGIAASEAGMASSDTLLHRASSALAGAKEQDPNSFQVYFSDRPDNPARLANLEQDVREAAEKGELDILFQPQVDIIGGRIAGVEALVRYEHPLYGTLSAETLLETAERAEFGIHLGQQIMLHACKAAAAWPEHMKHVRLSVNVTAADMRDRDFVGNLMNSLDASGFPAERLTLEITEGGLVEDLKRTSLMLAGLRERSIRVAIDDFGTGYSSLAYLKSLPLDYLKIDKKIAADIEGGARDKIIVRGVVDMARSLGMVVIAEGVETEAQLELLVREGCNWYQGYLCSPPLSSAELPAFVARWQGLEAMAEV